MFWQVTWNPKIYDYKKLIDDYQNGRHTGYIKQSKGKALMRIVPQIGDFVYISCDKKKIMKCEVVSNFVVNSEEINDSYCKGIRPHTENNTFLEIKIVEIYSNPEILLGYQRTWVKIN